MGFQAQRVKWGTKLTYFLGGVFRRRWKFPALSGDQLQVQLQFSGKKKYSSDGQNLYWNCDPP